jgi:hypothetical protein
VTQTNNKADGAAGARRAAALLGIALCAETNYTSLDEDAAKVDLKISFRHAFQENKLLTFHCQVKSGISYLARSSNKKTIKLRIDRDTITALMSSTGPALIAWVPPPPSERVYWYAFDARREPKTPIQFPRNQYISPLLRYDLTRAFTYSLWTIRLPRQDVAKANKESIFYRAKEEYKELKNQNWTNPLVGTLNVTRFGWRHVTRRSKVESKRQGSLRIVPYLKRYFNSPPDRYVIGDLKAKVVGSRTQITRYILFWYRNALRIDGDRYALLLRIREDISYPTKWERYPLGLSDVNQKATLASWWCKKE